MSKGVADLLRTFKKCWFDGSDGGAAYVGPFKAAYFDHADSSVRGLAATEIIDKDDFLLQMPREFTWSAGNVDGSRFEGMGPHAKLTFVLIEAKRAQTKAPTRASYLGSLPSLADYREEGQPLTATEKDLKILEKLPHLRDMVNLISDTKTQLRTLMGKYNEHLHDAAYNLRTLHPHGAKHFRTLRRISSGSYPKNPHAAAVSAVEWDDILWAGTAVLTRSFWCRGAGEDGSPFMVPIADSLNHSDNPNVVWHCKDGNMFLKALRGINIGEELTESYEGQLEYNSEEVFTKWGILSDRFLERWNAGDCDTIRAAHLEQSHSPVLRNVYKYVNLHCAHSVDAAPTVHHVESTVSKLSCVTAFLPPPRINRRSTLTRHQRRAFI